jgi:hypothetical protein
MYNIYVGSVGQEMTDKWLIQHYCVSLGQAQLPFASSEETA